MDVCIKQDKFHKIVYKKYYVDKIKKETQTIRNLFCYYSELACEKYNTEALMSDYLGYLYDAKYRVNLTSYGAYSLIEYSLIAVDPKYILDEEYNLDTLNQSFIELTKPYFDESLFDRAKEIYESDLLSGLENQNRVSFRNTLTYYFKGTNRDFNPNGYLDELYNITLDDLKKYYENIKKEEIISLFSGNYELAINSNSLKLTPKTNYNFKERTTVKDFYYEPHDTEQAYLHIIYEANTYASDNDFYAVTILNYILGGNASSLLFNIVREKYGLCYGIGSIYLGATGIIIISATIDYSSLDKVKKAIDEAFIELENGNYDLDNAINHFRSSLLIGEDYIETKISQYLTDNYFLDSPKSTAELAGYESVTKEDVLRALKKLKKALVYVYGGDN